jgi:hypothetical protein
MSTVAYDDEDLDEDRGDGTAGDEDNGLRLLSVADRLVRLSVLVLDPVLGMVGRIPLFLRGICAKQTCKQLGQIVATVARDLRSHIHTLRASAGLHVEETDTDGSTRVEVGSIGGVIPVPSVADSVSYRSAFLQSQYLLGALRCLQAVARFCGGLERIEATATNVLSRVLEDLFGLPAHECRNHFRGKDTLDRMLTGEEIEQLCLDATPTSCVNLLELKSFLEPFSVRAAQHEQMPHMTSLFSTYALPGAEPSVARLRITANLFLLDLCLLAPRKLLALLWKSDVWSTSMSVEGEDFRIGIDVHGEPLPQQLFTQVL